MAFLDGRTEQAAKIVTAVFIFTGLDYLLHRLLETQGVITDVVGQQYFVNKLVFGSLIALAVFFAWLPRFSAFGLRRETFFVLSVVLLLQLRYLYAGYGPLFHLVFIPAHYFFLDWGLHLAGVRA